MEPEVKRWLREHYRPAPSEGPNAKKMKFGDLHDDLATQFTSTSLSFKMVSQGIKSVFPNTFSKPVGKERVKHVFGLERIDSEGTATLASSPEHEALQQRVRELKQRVRELEQPVLSNEMSSLMTPNLFLYHGPNNITNFDIFSLDCLVEEVEKLAPNLFQLFQTLGQTSRNSDDDRSDDVMAVMSLCTLLKCRSQRVLGIQLLITLMLLARSTNKQVCQSAKKVIEINFNNNRQLRH